MYSPAEKGKGAGRPPGSAEGAFRPLPCARPAPDGGGRALRERGVPSSRGPDSAVLWAMAGLAAEFGMGSGRSPPPWPRSRRAPPALSVRHLAGALAAA